MPRKKAVPEQSHPAVPPQSLRKRSRSDIDISDLGAKTPTKRQRSTDVQAGDENGSVRSAGGDSDVEMVTDMGDLSATMLEQPEPISNVPEPMSAPQSTPRKRGRPPKNRLKDGQTPTPKAKGRPAGPQTPSKPIPADDSTPRGQAGADRSARRKSARALIEQVVGGEGSDDEPDDDNLAREIYESSEGEDDARDDAVSVTNASTAASEAELPQHDADGAGGTGTAATKTTTRRKRRVRTPTPPRDLPPHELYFAQNKPGRPKTSDNTLAPLALLTHDEYFSLLSDVPDRHKGEIEFLESLHAESFPQWAFELSQGFSVCLYGFGSKRAVLHRLAKHLHSAAAGKGKKQKIVVVNGYTPTTTIREILTTLAVAIDPAHKIPVTLPSTMVPAILSHLATTEATLTVIVNSIDAPPLRKSGYQAALAQLATHPQVQLACSADTPDFPLLWDIGLRSAYSFAFHDCTTFAPFSVELDVVDDVHELLGRKSQRVNGREGVAFVLRSLPENAKNLFQLLVGEVLIALEDEAGGAEDAGVEYRMVYNKAVEEFICSSEMAFRTLLKE